MTGFNKICVVFGRIIIGLSSRKRLYFESFTELHSEKSIFDECPDKKNHFLGDCYLEDRTTSVYGMSYELDSLATPDWGPHVQRDCPDSKEMNEIEANMATRIPFRRDKDRILYSKAFRRLIHKTQVCFTGEMNEVLTDDQWIIIIAFVNE
jgi:hypothetical protein